jgi:hypothetical protein
MSNVHSDSLKKKEKGRKAEGEGGRLRNKLLFDQLKE